MESLAGRGGPTAGRSGQGKGEGAFWGALGGIWGWWWGFHRGYGRVGVPERFGGSWGTLVEYFGGVSESSGGSWGLRGSPRGIWGHPRGVPGGFLGFGSTLGGSGGSQWGLGGFRGVGEVAVISLKSDFCFFSAADGETEEEAGEVRVSRSTKRDAGILFKVQRGVFLIFFCLFLSFFSLSFLQLQTEKETLLRDSRWVAPGGHGGGPASPPTPDAWDPPGHLGPPVHPRMELEELRARRDEEFRELQARNQQLQQELEAAAQVGAPGGGHLSALGVPWGAGGGVLGMPHGFVGVLGGCWGSPLGVGAPWGVCGGG